jgi:hypothetical protein
MAVIVAVTGGLRRWVGKQASPAGDQRARLVAACRFRNYNSGHAAVVAVVLEVVR